MTEAAILAKETLPMKAALLAKETIARMEAIPGLYCVPVKAVFLAKVTLAIKVAIGTGNEAKEVNEAKKRDTAKGVKDHTVAKCGKNRTSLRSIAGPLC